MVDLLSGSRRRYNFSVVLFISASLDLEFETEPSVPAPEPAKYETAYVTSHKGNCRAGCFSHDGQLIATGSVDASIKVQKIHKIIPSISNLV